MPYLQEMEMNPHEVQTLVVYANKFVDPRDAKSQQRQGELRKFGNKEDVDRFLADCEAIVSSGSKLEMVDV